MSDPPDNTIPIAVFFDRFTDPEKVAIATATLASPLLFLGLIHGLSRGQIDLLSTEVQAWLSGLVGAGIVTADRMTVVMTP